LLRHGDFPACADGITRPGRRRHGAIWTIYFWGLSDHELHNVSSGASNPLSRDWLLRVVGNAEASRVKE